MADLKQTLKALEALAYRKKFRQIEFFHPYPKQRLFFSLGATKRERMFMAGNQVGKSHCGAAETTYHLTGLYPADWVGKVFRRPTRGWAAGVTSLDVRNIQQKKLCGDPGVTSAFGTGLIPKDCFADKPSMARGVTDAFDTIQVKHFTNGKEDGISTLHFKSYEQGRLKFQGDTIDFGWGDEEGPMDVYNEFLTRLRGDGIMFVTFTPLLGRTELVVRYTDESSPDRAVVTMTLEEAEHFTAAERATRLAGYSRHEREARSRGVPMLGSGRVFITPEEQLSEPRIEQIPESWAKIWGIDFGIGHPFAAVLMLWDKDADVLHVHHCIRMQDDARLSLPIHHAAAMKPIGGNIPVAWPQDGTAREKGSGDEIASLYKVHGLKMLPEHATWPEGGVSTETGIQQLDERMISGRFKVAAHLTDWFEEYRHYHRKDGLIVKERDDLMSATRIALMMRRFAKQVQLGAPSAARRRNIVAEGVDFDVFA